MPTSTITVEFNEGRIINADEIHPVLCLVYRTADGTWQPMTQPGGGGGPASSVSITDAGGTDIADVIQLSVAPVSTNKGLLTQSVIHGLNSGGGGSYVDVKVTPSGALTVECTQSGTWTTGRTWTLAFGTDSVDVTGSLVGAAQSGVWSVGRTWTLSSVSDSVTVTGTVAISGSVAVTGPLTDAQLRAAPVPISAASLPLPTGAATEATLVTMLTLAGFQARINTLGQKTAANSTPVVLASDQSAIPVTGPLTDAQLRATPVPVSGTVTANPTNPSANARTSVPGAAADTLILASNANRKGATIFNDSTAILYLALGSVAASLTNFTVKMVTDAYYEVPFGYTGEIRGIWASAAGNARVGELT